ncbi:MAG TPA: VWA domain-containing protein [Thermoanaerobaculia bacterium]|nr:VWA domain-containing protein [Thermoanaerobaculia bacterium]
MSDAISLADPRLAWLALLAPLAAAAAAWVWRRRLRAVGAWASKGLWDRLLPGYRPLRLVLLVVLLAVAVAATALALARPRWGTHAERVERRGVDVVLVIDTSLSMAAPDVHPNRLTAAKLLARDLVAGLAGHRLGLVQSEGEGEVLAPLTLDRAVVDLFLDSLTPASLPTPGTRLSHGLGRALLLFPTEPGTRRVVVLISDGEDHGEDWDAAVKLIKESGVIVHTIGVGTSEGALLPLGGGGDGFKLDEDGKPVLSRLQPTLLRRVAETTGGVYVERGKTVAAATPIVDAVSRLATRSLGTEMVRQQQERFQWCLGVAVGALLLALATSPFKRQEAVA